MGHFVFFVLISGVVAVFFNKCNCILLSTCKLVSAVVYCKFDKLCFS